MGMPPTNNIKGGLAPLPPPPETAETRVKKASAFRAVGRDDPGELEEALKDVEVVHWLRWCNGAGDTLLKMADNRKRDKSLHWLRKRMGVSELVTNERPLVEKDNVWVFRQLGDPQPEQATVKEVIASDSGNSKDDTILVEYWDSKAKNEYIPAVRCRLMLQGSWEAEIDSVESNSESDSIMPT